MNEIVITAYCAKCNRLQYDKDNEETEKDPNRIFCSGNCDNEGFNIVKSLDSFIKKR